MSIKVNIISNFSGSIWNTAIALLAVPVYLDYLGIEAYALIGFYTLLLTIFSVLDMGLSPTMAREMAIFVKDEGQVSKMRDFARTLEIVYWGLGTLIGLLILLVSGFLGNHLGKTSSFEAQELSGVVTQLAVLIFARWPVGFYSGGFMGIERQLRFNVLNSSIETSKVVVGIVSMILFGKNIQVFFNSQIITTFLGTIIMMFTFWSSLPKGKWPKFNSTHIVRVKSFILGLSGSSLLALFLANMDKLILVNIVSLEDFGYYTLAATMAAVLLRIVYPFIKSIYPRLIQLLEFSVRSDVISNYHQFAQFLSVLIIPAAACGAFFSKELLILWTGDEVLSAKVWPIATLLFCGVGLNCLYILPYNFQLARGKAKKLLIINIISTVIAVPGLFVFVHFFGMKGAAMIFLLLNLGYLAIAAFNILYSFLKVEIKNWYLKDIGVIMVVAVASAGLLRYAFDNINASSNAIISAVLLLIAGVITFAVSVLVCEYPRQRAIVIIRKIIKHRSSFHSNSG